MVPRFSSRPWLIGLRLLYFLGMLTRQPSCSISPKAAVLGSVFDEVLVRKLDLVGELELVVWKKENWKKLRFEDRGV